MPNLNTKNIPIKNKRIVQLALDGMPLWFLGVMVVYELI